ncbi:hypothetical protein, partial [Mesorhizobium sp. M7A.F.Ca.US.006.04.2.1]|uniref:hypothetical protein n=1 Tax=Mesorhizobium sp. M7A.F.Ca.US.006.04.2.1 TaxID=2496696 RepID=UPI0019D4E556
SSEVSNRLLLLSLTANPPLKNHPGICRSCCHEQLDFVMLATVKMRVQRAAMLLPDHRRDSVMSDKSSEANGRI